MLARDIVATISTHQCSRVRGIIELTIAASKLVSQSVTHAIEVLLQRNNRSSRLARAKWDRAVS